MYKIVLLILLIGLVNCTRTDYCFFEIYQGGNVIDKVCSYCNMDGTHQNVYYKRVYDNNSCSYLNTQKGKKK